MLKTDSIFKKSFLIVFCIILTKISGFIREVVQAINYLMDNPDVAKQMGENGRKAVWEKYNWEVEEKKPLKLYEELQRI